MIEIYGGAGYAPSVPAEQQVVAMPRGYAKDGTLPGILMCHALGGSALYGTICDGVYGKTARALAELGPLISGDLAGISTWGNDASTDRAKDSVDYLRSTWGAHPTKKLAGWAVSMGAPTLFNLERRFPGTLSSINIGAGCLCLQKAHDDDLDFGSKILIENAYGGLSGYNTAKAAHDPLNFAQGLGVPIRVWYSDTDPYFYSHVAIFKAAVPNASFRSLGSLGHALTGAEARQVVNFAKRYV